MKIIEPLINELKNTLEEFEIKEDIDFKISNIEGFDYQINNLVKHQKNKDVRENIKNRLKREINYSLIK